MKLLGKKTPKEITEVAGQIYPVQSPNEFKEKAVIPYFSQDIRTCLPLSEDSIYPLDRTVNSTSLISGHR